MSGTDARPGGELARREPGEVYIPNGDTLLTDTRRFLRHFAVWPSESLLTVCTAAVAAMNAKSLNPDTGQLDPVWEYAFKLIFTAPGYGAGKTWLAKLCGSLTPSFRSLVEPTKPALIDMIADLHTVHVAEVDELLATTGRNRGIVAVMNTMFEPGIMHTKKDRNGKRRDIHLYGHMILDGKDDIFKSARPDTGAILSRSIVGHMVQAPHGYRRPMWDVAARTAARNGQRRLAAWMAAEVQDGMGASIESLADVPVDLAPRRRSLYEPLFTVAERADRFRAERDDDEPQYWTDELAYAVEQVESAVPEVADADDQGFWDELADDASVRAIGW